MHDRRLLVEIRDTGLENLALPGEAAMCVRWRVGPCMSNTGLLSDPATVRRSLRMWCNP
ncbi:MAG: hypothetical protein KAS72_13490 [Phycisphaerales bacterium]|nr:hypothetical protein [Phycisphaerales bacterium]